MGEYKVKGVNRHLKPRTVVAALLVVVLCVVAWFQRDNIRAVVDAIRGGALVPLVIATACESGRIVFHALAYTRSFKVIGHRVPLRDTVPAWFKAVFMNTVLPSGGTSGLAAVVDTARTRGVPVGSATTGALFTQTCFYLSMLLVIIAGFCVMAHAGSLQLRDVLTGCIMAVAAFAFVALLAMGHYAPGVLQRFMRWVERLAVRVLKRLHVKKQPQPWADNLVHSFSAAATEISRQPRRALTVFGSMVVAMVFDMCAFMFAGLAFGIDRPEALFGGYVTALVFNSFNVTPGGAGIVEGLASAVLAGYGYPLTVAVSAVLVYRALMYWIPLVVGGVMMYVTGAFGLGGSQTHDGADEPVYVRRRRSGRTLRERFVTFMHDGLEPHTVACAVAVALTGAVGLGAAVLPTDPVMVDAVTGNLMGDHPLGTLPMAVFSYLLLVCVPGILIHSQGSWLVAMASLLGLGLCTALSGRSIGVMVLVIVSMALLAVWRGSFDFHGYFESVARLARVLAYCVLLIVVYVFIGSLAVRSDVFPQPSAATALWMGFQSLLVNPSFPGVGLGDNALRFFVCVRAVAVTFTALVAASCCFLVVHRAADWRSPARREARMRDRAEAEGTVEPAEEEEAETS